MVFQSERDWVDWLQKMFEVPIQNLVRTWHEDATIKKHGKRYHLLSVDQFIENVHFRWSWMGPEDVGIKAVVRAVSDILVKGATPTGMWVAVAWPRDRGDDELAAFMRAVADTGRRYHANLLGGDTTRAETFSAAVIVTGTASSRVVLRSTLRPGHRVWVTGPVGWAGLGLALCRWLEQRFSLSPERPLSQAVTEYLQQTGLPQSALSPAGRALRSFFRPALPIRQWEILCRIGTASIDISDGLAADLTRICQASNVAVQLIPRPLRLPLAYRDLARRLGLDPEVTAWTGGEDYQWIVGFHKTARKKVQKFPGHFLGRVVAAETPGLLDPRGHPFKPGGWDVFRGGTSASPESD